jgi:glyoxylase-like metal-dependent hydrolase (beta-lactamase superfamily II)
MPQSFQSIPISSGSLTVAQSEVFLTNSGIFFDGGRACLIDPGLLPLEIMNIANFLDNQHLKAETILLTHAHWDHLFGPEYFPAARVIAHDRFCNELSGEGAERVINRVQAFDRESQVRRVRAFRIPAPDITFEESLTVHLGGLALEMIFSTGHSADQCVVYEHTSKVLWAADMLSDEEMPYIFHGLRAYRSTLERLRQLEISHLVPGHGAPTSDHKEINKRFKDDLDYLDRLGGIVERAVQAGKSLEETRKDAGRMRLRNPEADAGAHQNNVDVVYKEYVALP